MSGRLQCVFRSDHGVNIAVYSQKRLPCLQDTWMAPAVWRYVLLLWFFVKLESMATLGFYCSGIGWNSFPLCETPEQLRGFENVTRASIDTVDKMCNIKIFGELIFILKRSCLVYRFSGVDLTRCSIGSWRCFSSLLILCKSRFPSAKWLQKKKISLMGPKTELEDSRCWLMFCFWSLVALRDEIKGAPKIKKKWLPSI